MTDHSFQDEYDGSSAEGRGRRRGVLAALFVLLVLVGLYVAAAVYFGDRAASGTTVGGVNVAGMTGDEARAALERGVSDQASDEVAVTLGDQSQSIAPADAGLAIDYDASLEGLTGFSLNPMDLYDHVRGGTAHDLVTDVDRDALAAAVDEVGSTLDTKPKNGSVSLEGAKVKTTKSVPGREVDREALVDAIDAGWPDTGTYQATAKTLEPALTQADIDSFVGELKPLVSGPVVVRTTDELAKDDKTVSFEVPVDALASAISVKVEDAELTRDIDTEKVTAAVLDAGDSSGALRAAKDATVQVRGVSDFSVTPSKNGLGLKKDSIAEPVLEAMSKTGDKRVATVDSESTKPKLTTAQAKKTLPTEQISTFTTYMSTGGTRVDNIKLAARNLDGAYVPPGGTFSLNQHLGPRTAAKGYKEAGVIYAGRLREDYGGGISQLSTTLFNAVFFSGARIEEFHPHSFYISRYPEGREATISYPGVDNRFTNDTGAGILIKASASDSQVTVSFYGRKKYDVDAQKSERRNVTQPKTIRDSGEECVPQTPTPGFDVTVTRIMRPVGGGEAVTSSFVTKYIPQDDVTCTG
ncbi:VanW family protein [Marihabitans asiaticum]|uniref:Vancomycin resistance protein YoaR n=1 Tax=Marihabitans asiaticum TaxID=415218 RepID=A0A560WIF4_9MICO|nr:VanW family protein [Marihabitans asiaticum]TWD17304.1 vancomycin resistance protein YoaR [Marihabitans asiaticum]